MLKIALFATVLMISIVATNSHSQEVQVGVLYPQPPAFTDLNGASLDSVQVGRQVLINASFANITAERTDFVALVEVRNSDDVTVFLAWQSSTVESDRLYTIVVSWLVEESSEYYYARTFAFSDFERQEILSMVRQSEIDVK